MHYPIKNQRFTQSVALLLGWAALCSAASAQVRYELVVPEVPGASPAQTQPQGNQINENGEILLNRVATFAVWKDGAATHLVDARSDFPGTLSRISAASLNRYQQAVGSKTYRVEGENGPRFDTFPFYWDPQNGLVDLDDLGPRSLSGAGATTLYEINRQGLAIGSSALYDAHGTEDGREAFTWSFESGRVAIPALDALQERSVTLPSAINDSGQVVGTYRAFLESEASYLEKAFVYDAQGGARSLDQVDPDFFQSEHSTARDLNNAGLVVGERDRHAYLYDLANRSGTAIHGPDGDTGATRAYAVNDRAVVAGYAQVGDSQGPLGTTPILWTRATGTIDLLPQIENGLQQALPQGIEALDCLITPKRINNRGQISASLDASGSGSSFSREVILNPVPDFQWHAIRQTVVNGTRGVLYTHEKSRSSGGIPAEALGLQIAFECSSDMNEWTRINASNDAVQLEVTEATIQLFVPFAGCTFVRPVLVERPL